MKISERRRTSSYVSLGDIVKRLPINKRFTQGQFAKLTGISSGSANARVNRLVRAELLSKDSTGIIIKFYMTPENKAFALAKDKANRQKKGKYKAMIIPTPKEMALLEVEARIEHCDRILVAAGLL